MKVVVIGGGIAGLSIGIYLNKQKNIDVVVCERFIGVPVKGHAFLMHIDGLSALKKLSDDHKIDLPAQKINEFSFNRPDNTEIKHLKLNSWYCIKRAALIGFLNEVFPAEKLMGGYVFSHFLYENDKAIAAVFQNGEVVYGDLFIGADGGYSKVRESILPGIKFSTVDVKEVVGVAYNEKVASDFPNVFTKYQDKERGLAFGFIPTSGTEFVWFMQYDPSVSDIPNNSPEALREFCIGLMHNFPPVVQEILLGNNFSTSYIWETRDFDLLPTFHKGNVVLIGDAAHLTLPFTSAGTTNAILDAITLANCILFNESYEAAFDEFYSKRKTDIAEHISRGRDLKRLFLNPGERNDDDIPVPLISRNEYALSPKATKEQTIKVLYFTDPICSTCWIIQPLLRKLKLEYDNYLNIEYCMGGLLPSWEQYNSGKISKPSDAAKHWEEVCALHEMPLDGDVWIEDPLPSSFPPSVAFKAAQMQDTGKAILFLRRIKEMVFIEKKNIIKWEYLRAAAFEVGLDSARLRRDYDGKAKELFRADLVRAQELEVTGFPTLFFSDGSKNKFVVRGLQPYELFEDIIHKMVPSAIKENLNTTPENLFSFFPTMTEKEFSYLGNISKDEAVVILNNLYQRGNIDKYESKNGTIWISKVKAA